jgi:ATP-dependent Clp protease protease subunit
MIYNAGSVSSAAVSAFLGAPRRYASAHATFMIHRTRIALPAPGIAAMHRAIADSLEADDARTEAIIRGNTKIPDELWAAQIVNDVTITAQQALDFGIVHEIREFIPAKGSQIYNV